MANNEVLPFADQTFNAYIANLSIHLVNHPKRQIYEAYRVLKPGSAACFTIWGKKDECLLFTLVGKVFEKYLTPE